ncbi:hypothetical protein R1flu_024719 [Riccia fluitans]|uniref:Cyclic nucleotide-binding domain-containing protein n=1 Tax=Riccia fluitans TaxID=41844 RepID=A0ABD1XVQ2_9MARC
MHCVTIACPHCSFVSSHGIQHGYATGNASPVRELLGKSENFPVEMGRNGRVDHMPMLYDDSDSSHTGRGSEVELSRQTSSDDFSLRIGPDENDIADLYGHSGATVSVKGRDLYSSKRHEHLLKSGPLGKCSDPFCNTCPSYFGPTTRSDQVRFSVFGGAQHIRRRALRLGKNWFPGILNPHTKVVQRWNKIFSISSLIAVFIDPLFFFLFSVREDYKCLVFNNTAAVTVTVVRTLTDFVQICHIFLQFRLAYVANSTKIQNAGQLEDNPKKIAMHYLQGWFVLDLFTALPLPQVLVWTVVKSYTGSQNGANYAKNVLRVVVLLQNIPRALRFFPLLMGGASSGFVFETAWANFIINLLMYFLAGHVVGSCWYLFGLQRVNQCLQDKCRISEDGCEISYLDCGDNTDSDGGFSDERNFWINTTQLGTMCLGGNPDFFYGIYTMGVQVSMERKVIYKYIYSLFWGFQQISTLAGNLIPSLFVWEVLFTMGIVGLGLLLFALLIGNIQNFLMALGRRKLEMQLKRYDTEVWMRRRRLPVLLRRRVRQAGRFRWVATGGVEERELLADLPEDLQKDVQRYLCLELVKKVRLFELLEDHVLDAICERLGQKLYIEESEIFRAKKPVERMLFVVRGELESMGEDGSVVSLKDGEFCGEELLSWYIDVAGVGSGKKPSGIAKSMGKHPLSSRTVRCLTSVEAFSLEADDLEYITTHYKRAFKSPEVQGAIRYLSLYWRSMAARRIQKAWRARRARAGLRPDSSASHHRKATRFGTMNKSV